MPNTWLKALYLQEGDLIAVSSLEPTPSNPVRNTTGSNKDNKISNGVNLQRYVVWAKIQSIEFVGYEQVYDIEVEGTHNFIANGILAHNTYLSGNVGIGTTTPGASTKLNVNGLALFTGGTVNPGDGTATGVSIGYNTSSDYGFIQSVQTGVAWKNLILEPSSGNVGIGTTAPNAKLQVSDANALQSTSGAGNVNILTTTAAGVDVGGSIGLGGYFDGSNTNLFGRISGRKETATSGDARGYLAFATTNANATQGQERVRIDSNGNVGIGTTAPAVKLQVSGAFDIIPVALTDAVTIATDASLSNTFTVSSAVDRTLGIPTNPTTGQKCLWRWKNTDTAAHTLTLTTTGTGAFRFGSTITGTSATAVGKTDYIGAIYNATDALWDVIAYSKGY